MPEVSRPFDRKDAARLKEIPSADGCAVEEQPARRPVIPADKAWTAVLRGLRGQCPRCGAPGLFRAFLKPVDHYPACMQDWSLQRADDFPAYVAIFVTGHLIAPIIIFLVQEVHLPLWALITLVLTLALTIMLASLQPAKGAIIALQWWFAMHGFKPDHRE